MSSLTGTRRFAIEDRVSVIPKNDGIVDKVALGAFELVHKFGANRAVSSGEDVWSRGGTWVAPTAARVHSIVSTSAADTVAGTGARTLSIQYLDENKKMASATLSLAGLTPVLTPAAFRIFRMKLLTVGSGGTNAGTITATAAVDGTVTAEIAIGGANQTQMAIWTSPTDRCVRLTGFYAFLNKLSGGGTADCDVLLQERDAYVADAAWTTIQEISMTVDGGPVVRDFYPHVIVFPDKDVKLTCPRAAGSGSIILMGGFDAYLL